MSSAMSCVADPDGIVEEVRQVAGARGARRCWRAARNGSTCRWVTGSTALVHPTGSFRFRRASAPIERRRASSGLA